MVEICASARSEFKLENFEVFDTLLGKGHKFEFDGRLVQITLPSKRQIEASNAGMEFAHQEYASLGMEVGSTEEKDGKKHNIYLVRSVYAAIDFDQKFQVKKSIIESNGNIYTSLSNTEKNSIKRILEESGAVARKAYQYWLRVVRWKAQFGLIGRTVADHPDRNWNVAFCEASTGKRLGFSRQNIVGSVPSGISSKKWSAMARALKSGKDSPIWWELLFEGEVARANGDFRGATLHFAISIESYLRYAFVSKIPKSVDDKILEMIQSQMGIRQIVNWANSSAHLNLSKKEWSNLHELFNARNRFAHEGTADQVGDAECEKFRSVCRKILKMR